MRIFPRLACLAALALAAACAASIGTDKGVRQPSVVSFYDSSEITIPATVRAGETFTVSVKTWLGDCSRPDGMRTFVSGATAEVRPHDLRVTGKGTSCPNASRSFVHQTTVRFDAPGEARVRVHGRQEPDWNNVAISYPVTVQPAS
jgi:hypothetical protein